MFTLSYQNRSFSCPEGKTVLDVLLDNSVDVSHSCKMGMCVSCIMRVVDGNVPAEAQEGIRPSLSARGHFLPCLCIPDEDMRVEKVDSHKLFGSARVEVIEKIAPDICRILLDPVNPVYYRAGQFMNLRRKDGVVRSYSLASLPHEDEFLEFHVRRLKNGEMSNWLMDELKVGGQIDIQGPNGNCYYIPDNKVQNLLLIGSGTGLAPMIGIVRDAISSGHKGSIILYHSSDTFQGLYLDKHIRSLALKYPNFSYHPCVLHEGGLTDCFVGRVDDIAFSTYSNVEGWRVYLCGQPEMVKSARFKAVAAGARTEDIFEDPFELKDLRGSVRNLSNQKRN